MRLSERFYPGVHDHVSPALLWLFWPSQKPLAPSRCPSTLAEPSHTKSSFTELYNNHITSLHSFISFIGWKLLSGFSSSCCFLRIHGTTPTYLADELLEPADLGIRTRLYDRRWPHHCWSAVHGCRLSATELFLSPLPAPATTCRATSSPHHLCLFSEDAPLPTFFSVTFVQCLRSDSSHYWHSNRSFCLLTYLQSPSPSRACHQCS